MSGKAEYVTDTRGGLGTGRVLLGLGGGVVRVRFVCYEASVREDRLRPATEDEIAAADIPKPLPSAQPRLDRIRRRRY